MGGAALGARIGASLGVGAADLATVGTERFFNAFAKEGVDITDPDALRAALGNPEMVKKARDHALRAALPMAAFDALSAGLAGKLVGVAKTPIARTLAAGAETFGMHPALGVTGMAAGQQLSEGKIDPGQLATAAVGQIGIGGLMTGLGSIKPDSVYKSIATEYAKTDPALPHQERVRLATNKAYAIRIEKSGEKPVLDAITAKGLVEEQQAEGRVPKPFLMPDFLSMYRKEIRSKDKSYFTTLQERTAKFTESGIPKPEARKLALGELNAEGVTRPSIEGRRAGAFETLLSDEYSGVGTPGQFRNAVRSRMEDAPSHMNPRQAQDWAIRQMVREDVLPQQPTRSIEEIEAATRESLAKGMAIRSAKAVSEKLGPKALAKNFIRGFFNSDADLYKWINGMRKMGYKFEEGTDPIFALQAHSFAEAIQSMHMTKANEVLRPEWERSGIKPDDIEMIMKANRIANGDRQFMENPLSPDEAKLVLETMNQRHGAENVSIVTDAWKTFAETVRKPMIEFAVKHGVLNPEQAAGITKPESLDFYATFNVIDYLDHDIGKLFTQKGTLKDVESVITATLMKDQAFIKTITKAAAGRSLVNFVNDMVGQEVAIRAAKDMPGRFREPPTGSGLRLITFMQNNERVGYWVPEGMSKTLAESPKEVTAWSRMYRAIHDPIRKLFVDYNPGFAIYNPIRDTASTYKNITLGNPVLDAVELGRSLWRTRKEARRVGWRQKVGPEDVNSRELMENAAIVAPSRRQYEAGDVAATGLQQSRIGVDKGLHPMDQAFAQWGLIDTKHLAMRMKLKTWADRVLSAPGAIGERWTKLAAYDMLKRNQERTKMTNEEIFHAVRNYAGTPNPMLRGDWYKTTNSVFLFSNIRKNGYAASWRSFQNNPFTYATKTMMFDVAPTMLKIAAAHGLLNSVTGEKFDEFFRKVSEYDKENYMIVPLGYTKSGKAVYIPIPHDHVGQSLSKELWRSTKDPVNLQKILDVVWNEFPYTLSTSALHPAIHSVMDATEYAQGNNPYDSYKGQPVIPENVFKAGGVDAAAAMWKHIGQTLGGGVLMQFSSDNQSDVLDELEMRLNGQPFVQGAKTKAASAVLQFGIDHQRTPILSNVVRRMVRVSDYGQQQFAKEAIAGTKQREAAVKLDREKIIKDMLAADPTVTSYAILNELKRRKIPITNRSSLVKTIKRLRTRIYSSSMKDKAETYGGSKAQRDIVGRMG